MRDALSVKTSETQTLPSWQLFALAGLVGATLVVFVSRGQSPAAIILLSLVIFAAAAVGAAALRTLLPFARGSLSLSVPIVAGRARAAIEREKTLVLRSIKELEFDHAMGKVSDQDFADMTLRLKMRAAGLLRQLDAGAGYSTQIERELARRLEAAGVSSAPAVAPTTVVASPSVTRPSRFCTECGAPVDPSAKFCGQCGHKLVSA